MRNFSSINSYPWFQEKRLKFPRFYFLSDDDLLEILGQANKPEIVQSHLKKLFAGINCVIFDENNVIGVQSLEKETVRLKHPVTISLDVEVMQGLESLNCTVGIYKNHNAQKVLNSEKNVGIRLISLILKVMKFVGSL